MVVVDFTCNCRGGDITVEEEDPCDPNVMLPSGTQPITSLVPPCDPEPTQVKSAIEVLPGLMVEPRFINGNWHLIPVGPEHQLPDVEKMIIEDLAEEIAAGEMTMGDKCCLINALAARRKAQVETLRNVMGLFGTDKPIPLTEILPFAEVTPEDQALNDLPTAADTGIEQFDFIEYDFSHSVIPEILGPLFTEPYEFTYIWPGDIKFKSSSDYYGKFQHGERVRIYLVDKVTGERVSDIAETVLRFWMNEFPPNQWAGYVMDHIRFTKPNLESTYYDTWEHIGPYGQGPGVWMGGYFYRHNPIDDPAELNGLRISPSGWPGGKAIGLRVSAFYYGIPIEGFPGNLNPSISHVGVIVERLDHGLFGVDLTLGYHNHPMNDITLETRRYERSFPHDGLLAEVAADEIKLLDDIRLQGLINAPQYTKGKAALEVMKGTLLIW